MAISGLVITLKPDAAAAAVALEKLGTDPRLTLGERFGRRIAIVAETPAPEADDRLWTELRETPGVEFVDVAFVRLDACPDGAGPVPAAQEDAHAHR